MTTFEPPNELFGIEKPFTISASGCAEVFCFAVMATFRQDMNQVLLVKTEDPERQNYQSVLQPACKLQRDGNAAPENDHFCREPAPTSPHMLLAEDDSHEKRCSRNGPSESVSWW
jgi:hypothetical protein